MPLVVATSGWREHNDIEFITTHLVHVTRRARMAGEDLFFRVGDNKGKNGKLGADRIVLEWLRGNFPDSFQVYQANWDKLGNYAGPDRNKQMLEGEFDPWGPASLLLAFPQPGVYRYRDSGTWGCCKEAFRRGVRVEIPAYRTEDNEVSN